MVMKLRIGSYLEWVMPSSRLIDFLVQVIINVNGRSIDIIKDLDGRLLKN